MIHLGNKTDCRVTMGGCWLAGWLAVTYYYYFPLLSIACLFCDAKDCDSGKIKTCSNGNCGGVSGEALPPVLQLATNAGSLAVQLLLSHEL